MASNSFATPAFGTADLSNCEREEIHLAGSIQPHGALLVISEPDHRIIQASTNAAKFLNLDKVVGMQLSDIDGDLLLRILPHLDPTSQGMPIAVRCRIGNPHAEFDGIAASTTGRRSRYRARACRAVGRSRAAYCKRARQDSRRLLASRIV